MADITLFEADLSGSTFVAPFGRHVVTDRVDVTGDDESSGGRGKLLVGGFLGVVAVAGLAFVVVRRFRGGSEDTTEASEWGDEDWNDENEFGFGVTDRDTEDGRVDEADDDTVEAEAASNRSGAVAAVVGLLFLLFVTALVRRRRPSPDPVGGAETDREPVTVTR